uniref:LAGLIDADG_2 domain-containing protein n=1 Tax=Echinococcus granulosus TaxID=6210 RepID=U6FTX7_ECHGR|nr:hypothetical protein EgrG_002063100 [Echinococcus granulosus]CDS25083.1 hypothetical protein EgrG_002058400 [Echinococcus granulosus]
MQSYNLSSYPPVGTFQHHALVSLSPPINNTDLVAMFRLLDDFPIYPTLRIQLTFHQRNHTTRLSSRFMEFLYLIANEEGLQQLLYPRNARLTSRQQYRSNIWRSAKGA